MAKMTEEQAIALLASGAALAAQIVGLIPQLVANFQAIKDGLATDDGAALNARIVTAHESVQSLDASLAAMRDELED